MTLLDGNLLIALVLRDHVHAAAARAWFGTTGLFATSPTVQGTLVRTLVGQGMPVGTALRGLRAVQAHTRHRQWLDDLTYAQVDLSRVLGRRQVTDAYLAALARSKGGRLATFDRGLFVTAPDVAELVPV